MQTIIETQEMEYQDRIQCERKFADVFEAASFKCSHKFPKN